jgi:cell division protein FtsL
MVEETVFSYDQITLPARGSRRFVAEAIADRKRPAVAFERSVPVKLTLAMVFVAIASLVYLAQASQASVIELNIASLQQEGSDLSVTNANLHAQAARLRAVTRVSQAAVTQFHMVQPNGSSIVWISIVVPRVTPQPDISISTLRAQRSSQPLAWVNNLMNTVVASL